MEVSHFNSLRDPAARVEHRDLARVAANQVVDGIPVINRSKGLLSPFTEISKVPNTSENGNHAGYSIELEDDSAPHGWRHVGNVSSKYLVLPNRDIYDLACEVADASGLPWAPGRAYWDGSKFACVLDFGRELAHDVSAEGDGSDLVGLSLVFQSSYDTSWAFRATLCGRRHLCDNLHFSMESFAQVRFRHTTGSASDDWRGVVTGGLGLVRQAPRDLGRFVRALRLLRAAQTSDRRLREVVGAWDALGDGLVGRILRRYAADEEPTLFGLLQAGTAATLNEGRVSASSWSHNEAVVSSLVAYADEHLGR